MTVSRMTVPMIQPMTARVASFSDLAEKNFWYMDWLPSMSRQVGRKSSMAWMKVRSPKSWKWVAGRAAWTADHPPKLVDEDGEREAEGEGGEQADGDVHVGDRGHAGDGGEEDDEGGDDVAAVDGGDGVGKMRWRMSPPPMNW